MDVPNNERAEKIMINGRIHLARPDNPEVEVRRGMMVKTRDGQEAGMVAAVIMDEQSQNVSYVLLCHLPVTSDYRLIPVNLIAQVSEEAIHLNIHSDVVEELAIHQPR
ncbi:MAG: PRC-barrel domain-containing protein [Anaerolineae bacterium]